MESTHITCITSVISASLLVVIVGEPLRGAMDYAMDIQVSITPALVVAVVTAIYCGIVFKVRRSIALLAMVIGVVVGVSVGIGVLGAAVFGCVLGNHFTGEGWARILFYCVPASGCAIIVCVFHGKKSY